MAQVLGRAQASRLQEVRHCHLLAVAATPHSAQPRASGPRLLSARARLLPARPLGLFVTKECTTAPKCSLELVLSRVTPVSSAEQGESEEVSCLRTSKHKTKVNALKSSPGSPPVRDWGGRAWSGLGCCLASLHLGR